MAKESENSFTAGRVPVKRSAPSGECQTRPENAPSALPRVEDYEPHIGAEAVERILGKTDALRGSRVLNFNSTYYGGGVAEILTSLTLRMNTAWRPSGA